MKRFDIKSMKLMFVWGCNSNDKILALLAKGIVIKGSILCISKSDKQDFIIFLIDPLYFISQKGKLRCVSGKYIERHFIPN